MRIISGKYKGRELVSFRADHIRPTTDRVKETLFNILMHDIPEARVLDLFAGTGNLGLEAHSRGARYVEFVELHKISLKILSENLEKLKVKEGVKVRPGDVFKYLKAYKDDPFQVIFIDPPFTEKIAHPVMEAVAQSKVGVPGTLAIIESSRHERIDDKYGAYQLLDRREFGDKRASIFRMEQTPS